MLGWLVKYSPLTVSVNARSWQDYQGIYMQYHLGTVLWYHSVVLCVGGIIQHHCDGSPPDIVDHAVQIVGFDLTGRFSIPLLKLLRYVVCVCVYVCVCVCVRPCAVLDCAKHMGYRLGRRWLRQAKVQSQYVR